MSTLNPSPSSAPAPAGPHAGQRLSPLRVALGVVVVLGVVAAGLFGFRVFVVDQARATGLAPWFASYVDATVTPSFPFETPPTDAQRDVVLSFVVAASGPLSGSPAEQSGSGSADDPADAPTGAAADPANGSCTPSWGTAYSLDGAAQSLDLDRRIARLRQQGGDVMASFGGANNSELATACTDPAALKDAYEAVVDRYDLSTIDLDIEGGNLTDAAAGERRAEAVAALQTERRAGGHDLAVWLTLPIGPSGLLEDGTDAVAQMLDAGVDLAGVNAMTMDYGVDLDGASLGRTAIDSLNGLHRQLGTLYSQAGIDLTDATLWSKIGATPMIGQNDVPAEVFSLADAQTLSTFAQDKQLGRLSMWSLNRDATCGPNYVDTRVVSNACSGVDQGDASFAGVLAQGFGGSPDAAADTVTTPEPTTAVVDDPATSPYPIWSESASYLAGAKVVLHGNVYTAKWWTRGDTPDDPVLNDFETPWTLVGPVLPGEKPFALPSLPEGTFPTWSGAGTYEKGDRVLFEGTPYEAKWWTQGDSPAASSADTDGSPWVPLTEPEIAELTAPR
ncbi:carbohydrate-binding protein [Herbiconiux sp.]|uniref:chitinase n=1 Tax=Herbiconiux sp. TaxID=1871186 RepID=UPI0025C4D8D8|nr:carbohydrate-binding protein [Herbiconiux sp.]